MSKGHVLCGMRVLLGSCGVSYPHQSKVTAVGAPANLQVMVLGGFYAGGSSVRSSIPVLEEFVFTPV